MKEARRSESSASGANVICKDGIRLLMSFCSNE